MYTRPPTEQELANTGLTPADYDEEVQVWPENWPVQRLFSLMSSQWDRDINGRAGLKYQVLFELLDRKGLTGDEFWETFDDIRAMEAAAMDAMRGA